MSRQAAFLGWLRSLYVVRGETKQCGKLGREAPKMRSRLLVATFCVVAVATGILGCASMQVKPEAERYIPHYDFTPPENAAPGSADVSFAIVMPRYEVTDEWDEYWTQQWPFDQIAKNMGLDFQEVLSARGFTTRGPYESYEEITFPDKKGTDLVLVPHLDISLNVDNRDAKVQSSILGAIGFKLEGEAMISGRVSLSVNESLTNERMWFKSIELETKRVPWKGSKTYAEVPPGPDLSDPSVSEPLARAFEEMYGDIMSTAWRYLHPDEMAMVKSQAMEIKEKKTY
jgi:hypothetical protein